MSTPVRAASVLAVAGALIVGSRALAQDTSPPFDAPGPAASDASLDRPADAHPAATGPTFAYAVNAGVASDYVFRGVDQTHGGVEGFAGVDVAYAQVYLGAWTSNVDFNAFGDRRTYDETDLYAGWRPSYAGFNLDLGAIYYGYLGQAGNLDYAEAYLKLSRSIGPLTAGVSVHASPNYPGVADGGYYAEGNAAYLVTSRLTVSTGVGHKGVDGPDVASCTGASCLTPNGDFSYTTWNLGASYTVVDHLDLALRYTDTDAHRSGAAFGDKIVLEARATFP